MDQETQSERGWRLNTEFAATLTTCAGTWLEQPPDAAEQQRIDTASRHVREQRKLAIAFHHDPQAANLFSIELFRRPEFAPLHMADWLIERIITTVGEPPVTEDVDGPAFSAYLRRAVLSIADPQVRRALAGQLRRYLPRYVEAGEWKKAVAIDNNAFRTSLGKEATPFLVQMTLEGLARWYETYEAGDEAHIEP